MKATIALTNPQLADQILKSLITLIQGNSQLQQHITNHGIWFENLATETVAAFKQLLHTLDYSTYDSTDAMLHLRVANNDANGLLKILLQPDPVGCVSTNAPNSYSLAKRTLRTRHKNTSDSQKH